MCLELHNTKYKNTTKHRLATFILVVVISIVPEAPS